MGFQSEKRLFLVFLIAAVIIMLASKPHKCNQECAGEQHDKSFFQSVHSTER